MGYAPVLKHTPTDPIVDPVSCLGCGGQYRQHAEEDGRHHFDVSACRSFKTALFQRALYCEAFGFQLLPATKLAHGDGRAGSAVLEVRFMS